MSLIKQLDTELSSILCSIFNKSFSEGVFPDFFKSSKVVTLKLNFNYLRTFFENHL